MNTVPTTTSIFSPARLSRPVMAAVAVCAALGLAAGAAAVSRHAAHAGSTAEMAAPMSDGFADTPARFDEPMAAYGQ